MRRISYDKHMIREEIRKIIEEAGKKAQKQGKWPDFKMPEIQVEHPENTGFGDYSTNVAMILAGLLKRNPMRIAELLVDKIQDTRDKKQETKYKIQVVRPGFINFTLSEKYLREQVEDILKQGDEFGRLKIGKNKNDINNYGDCRSKPGQ